MPIEWKQYPCIKGHTCDPGPKPAEGSLADKVRVGGVSGTH
ncbi:hypothetical protein CLU85_0822 [Acidovorax sp. 69]|nr:hypothetical protein CLU85_0822 [Acidovorax sp. 69]